MTITTTKMLASSWVINQQKLANSLDLHYPSSMLTWYTLRGSQSIAFLRKNIWLFIGQKLQIKIILNLIKLKLVLPLMTWIPWTNFTNSQKCCSQNYRFYSWIKPDCLTAVYLALWFYCLEIEFCLVIMPYTYLEKWFKKQPGRKLLWNLSCVSKC